MFEFGIRGSEEQRARLDDEVRTQCSDCRVPGHSTPLSDAAATAIAAGRVDDTIRAVLVNRWLAGRTLPSVGGFGALRSLVDDHARWMAKDTANKPGSSIVYRLRAAELTKRIDRQRTAVLMSNRHYGVGVRAVRKERRDGVHLDLAQRDALFDALTRTPAPQRLNPLAERGLSLVDAATDRVTALTHSTSVADRVERVTGLVEHLTDRKDDRFADRYDTLLFVAGASFDRVLRSPAWRSPRFEIQRNQVDLFSEVVEISVDAASLEAVDAELNGIIGATVDEQTAAHIESRHSALDVVWTQLIGRVAALVRLAVLVESCEGEVRTSDVVARAHRLDGRIDDLIGRSGEREMSADNTHFVGDQLRTWHE